MSKCARCGTENTADSNYCRHCGERLVSPGVTETTEDLQVGTQGGIQGRVPAREPELGTVLQITADGDREGEIIGLAGDVVTIGRTPESDLFLDDVTVSRHHARIVVDSGAYFVEDLNSLNGTYVNHKRIERHQLFDGDELQIGKFKLAFVQQKTDERP
jgi:hypothetical protein